LGISGNAQGIAKKFIGDQDGARGWKKLAPATGGIKVRLA